MNPLLNRLEANLLLLDERQLKRHRRTVDARCAPQTVADGERLLAFCSNDYLGLASHPAVIAALQEGAERYGVGSGASHLISGHGKAHALLEDELAAFISPHLESPRALLFSTGYMANLSVLSALGGRDAELFCEELNHASLIDGARLSRSAVKVYPHGDVEALEGLLKVSRAETRIVVTDSVFSMDGNIAPLPQLLALCEHYGAWLVVDDAHGFGILGADGRGALEHFNLRSEQLIYIGTLGKAAGVSGAFVAAHETVIEWLVQRARPYIYTTASPPALAHALSASLALIAGREGMARRQHLNLLVTQFRASLHLKHWQLMPSTTAIQPVCIGASGAALAASAALQRGGLWVPAIRPPTVPRDTARLRVTFSAAHEHADMLRLAQALQRAEEECHGS
jgi:8-amino-7-oxononanoate synthase